MVSAPASLRNAFLELLEEEPTRESACGLAGKLLDCTDDLPYEYCEILDLPAGATFGEAARHLRTALECAD